jgi:Flp pilus assembly protein TadG
MKKIIRLIHRFDTQPEKKSLDSQRGATLVEFAIIASVLFLLLFAIIEFGMYLYNQQVITNASREGVRAGIVSKNPRITDTEIEQIVNNYCQNHLVTFGNANNPITVSDSRADAKFGENLTVTVSFNYGSLFLPFMTKVMQAQAVMRYE